MKKILKFIKNRITMKEIRKVFAGLVFAVIAWTFVISVRSEVLIFFEDLLGKIGLTVTNWILIVLSIIFIFIFMLITKEKK